MRIDAIIFDMDGLMFDTETIFLTYFRKVCQRFGIDIPKDLPYSLIGQDTRTVNRYEEQYPGITHAMDVFQEERLDAYFDLYKEPGSGNMKGLAELVAYCNQEGIPYAIASSSEKEDILRLAKHAHCGIAPKVVVSSRTLELPSKPAPDIFLETARQLEVQPQHTLVLEDSKNGILAANAAGMISMCIPDKIEVDSNLYQYQCDSLLEAKDWIIENRQ